MADIQIINLSAKGDIIITQDWGLAAMVLGKAKDDQRFAMRLQMIIDELKT